MITPEIELKQIELEDKKFEREEKHEERQWKSCCFQLEPESSMFFAKLSISTMTIALCSYQLITQVDCSYQSLYSSILSVVITFWLNKK